MDPITCNPGHETLVPIITMGRHLNRLVLNILQQFLQKQGNFLLLILSPAYKGHRSIIHQLDKLTLNDGLSSSANFLPQMLFPPLPLPTRSYRGEIEIIKHIKHGNTIINYISRSNQRLISVFEIHV